MDLGTIRDLSRQQTVRARRLCDKMGDGDNGRSTGISEILNWLQSGFGYAIVEEGQFQIYIGEFEPPHRDDVQDRQTIP